MKEAHVGKARVGKAQVGSGRLPDDTQHTTAAARPRRIREQTRGLDASRGRRNNPRRVSRSLDDEASRAGGRLTDAAATAVRRERHAWIRRCVCASEQSAPAVASLARTSTRSAWSAAIRSRSRRSSCATHSAEPISKAARQAGGRARGAASDVRPMTRITRHTRGAHQWWGTREDAW